MQPFNYIGNPDYRGYLAYRASTGDGTAETALNFVGNDGGVNDAAMRDYLQTGGDQAADDANYAAFYDYVKNTYGEYQNAISGGDGGGSTSPNYRGENLAFLDDQRGQLSDLLNRTGTYLEQGLTRNRDEYAREKGEAQREKEQAYSGYADKRIETNQGKLGAYNTINRNAGTGYRSLAQIIGRASGTGSSAFRELLPDVVGKDTSSKRRTATETYGKNLADIDRSQGQYDISFADLLADLVRQKRENEGVLRGGIEQQRQGLNQQLLENAAQRAQTEGGSYDSIRNATAPFQEAINSSRDAVEGFFSQFRTPYQRQAAVAPAPNMAAYNVDRAAINARAQGAAPENPYGALLRRRLQEQNL